MELSSIKILADHEVRGIADFPEILALFENKIINPEYIYRIGVIQDGNSLLHAVCKAFYKPYIKGYMKDNNGQIFAVEKRDFISSLRRDLGTEIDKRKFPELINILESSFPLDARFYQLVAQALQIKLYILENNAVSFFQSPESEDSNIVLINIHGNYELIGFNEGMSIKTNFTEDDLLIKELQKI